MTPRLSKDHLAPRIFALKGQYKGAYSVVPAVRTSAQELRKLRNEGYDLNLVTSIRAEGILTFPANFTLVGAKGSLSVCGA